MTTTTFVYFTECADTIKIGYSANPRQRAKSLRGSVLASAPGDGRLESRIHKRFDHLRAERIPRPGNADTEHFHKDPELLSFIERVAAGECPEQILTAELRLREASEYADLISRSRGNAAWLQARVLLTYEAKNYVRDCWPSGYQERRDAIESMYEIESAWECLDAGECRCRCHQFGADRPIRTEADAA